MKPQHIRALLEVGKARSDDPDTQVGCVIRTVAGHWIVEGNRLPPGVEGTPSRCRRPAKYQWLEHAERAAIYSAARAGVKLLGARMYLSRFPCVDCARAIVAVGIGCLYAEVPDYNDERWGEQFKVAQAVLRAGGVEVRRLEEVVGNGPHD